MKILDRYILTSFIKTFLTVFVILFFIFILQAVWLFIAELAGKDLDTMIIVKFLAFYAPKIVPLVLPLSILLASIMTFGSFSENYEFAAMKSAGISLGRAMRGLTIFIAGLSIVAFFFANDIIPKAEYKFLNLRRNIVQKKPAMAIVEGQFNAIGTNFNIKVDKKSGENGEKLKGVTIHKRKPGSSYATIIRAKRGLLKSNEESNMLQLELFDGYYYEEISANNPAEHQKVPFAKSSFSKQIMNIDLSSLNPDDGDDEQIAHTNNMLNVKELRYTIDSLQTNYDKEVKSIGDNIAQRNNNAFHTGTLYALKNDSLTTNAKKENLPKSLLGLVKTKEDKIHILSVAANNASSVEHIVTSAKGGLFEKTKNINNHLIALYEKFVIAFSCLLMFFIGAPLGAIIRKGGLGLPIVFAVLIFIIFHFINTFGKKLAQENGIPPYLGSWMSSIVLTPLAVLLTYRATNDMGVSINFDWIALPFKKLFPKDTTEDQPLINIDIVRIASDKEWIEMNTYPDEQLMDIVKNAKQFNYTANYRNRALKILDGRGITQEDLMASGSLYNIDYQKTEYAYNKYLAYTALGLITYGIGLAFPFLAVKPKVSVIVFGIINYVIFYLAVYQSVHNLHEIGKRTGKKTNAPMALSIITAFPFFIFTYFYNKSALKKALQQHNYKF